MNTRARQLLLEILLLSEKYSEKEFEWARQQLTPYSGTHPLGDIIKSLISNAGRPSNEAVTAVEKVSDAPNEVATNLLNQILEGRTSTDLNRLKVIARRLKISTSNKTNDEIIEAVRIRINQLSLEDTAKALKGYKLSRGPDENYVGLAQFLIRDRDKD